MTATPSPPLLWMSPALAGGGYASEALAFAQGLAARLPTSFRLRQFAEQPDVDFMDGLPKALLSVLQLVAEAPNSAPHAGVVVCHSPPDAWVPSKFSGWDVLSPCPPPGASVVIGRTMYETDSVPEEWVQRCNRMDSVWVPTSFHLETFQRAGVHAHKLRVVGEPVDVNFFNPSLTAPLALPSPTVAPFRFLAVFKWEKRKGWDVLLRAYFEEFRNGDNVELILKTRPFHSSDDFDGLISTFANEHDLPAAGERAAVRILSSELPSSELPSLYAAADAFVLPSRGEGWGRPHVEAMAMARPVIATNWSDPTSFLDESVGYPLEYTLKAVDPELNLAGHRWAEPSVTHLRQLLRHVYAHPEEAKARGRAARERMVKRYSPEVLAEDVLAALRDIGDGDHADKEEL